MINIDLNVLESSQLTTSPKLGLMSTAPKEREDSIINETNTKSRHTC
jgi:hypothetical protein